MATIKLIVRGKSNPSPLHARFINGRDCDLSCVTGVLVNPDHWDNKKGNYRNTVQINLRNEKFVHLEKLKTHIVETYNEFYMSGHIIDNKWLTATILSFFNRPVKEIDGRVPNHLIYYIDYAEWWLEVVSPSWKTGKNKFLDKRAKDQYQSLLILWRRFSASKEDKFKIVEVDNRLLNEFAAFLQDDEGYAEKTVQRHIGRTKFFLTRARNMDLRVANDYTDRIFISKDEEVMDPVLSEEEIESVFNLNLSDRIMLDNIRDNAIIGLWTGLRISDFNHKLDTEHIDDDFIRIKTTKTGSWVIIPLHPQVKSILKKRGGALPIKYNDGYFNIHIKSICRMAGIKKVIYGKKYDGQQKRKSTGYYPKYKLISSHFCRRSFTTNLYGLIPDRDLTNLGGWTNMEMMLHYVKRNKTEIAQNLKNVWDKKYSTKNIR